MKPITGFIRKEFRQALRDRRMKIMLFGVPVIQLTLFGLALSNEVKNIRLLSFYQPSDVMTKTITEKAVSSGWFTLVPTNGDDPVSALKAGRADAALVAPREDLAASIERGDGRLQLLVEATNAVRARSVEAYMQQIISDTLIERRGPVPLPVSFDVRVLYNPSLETSIFMVPGVMVMILALITIVLTAMSIARERELGTMEMLIATPASKREILLGKTVPYVLLALIDVPLVLVAARLLFNVPLNGSIFELAIAAFFFVVTTVSVGTLISTFARDQQQAMMGAFMFMMPAMLLSGVMYPVENMPAAIKWITYLNPLCHFATLMRNIMLKGGDAIVVLSHSIALAALAGGAALISALRFRNTLN